MKKILRVAVTGPESTGKSTLSQQLAAHYQTTWAPEYAREYLTRHGPQYTLADLEVIARGQLATEAAAAARADRVVFCDTDLTVLKIWAESAFGECPAWIEQELHRPRYDLVLLPDIDLPWEPDPLREHPQPGQRRYFQARYRQALRAQSVWLVEVGGLAAARLAQATAAVDALLRRQPVPVYRG